MHLHNRQLLLSLHHNPPMYLTVKVVPRVGCLELLSVWPLTITQDDENSPRMPTDREGRGEMLGLCSLGVCNLWLSVGLYRLAECYMWMFVNVQYWVWSGERREMKRWWLLMMRGICIYKFNCVVQPHVISYVCTALSLVRGEKGDSALTVAWLLAYSSLVPGVDPFAHSCRLSMLA